MEAFIVFGAGGHAKVVVDAALESGCRVTAVVDDAPRVSTVLGVPVWTAQETPWRELGAFGFVVAIGDNRLRARVYSRLVAQGGRPAVVIHPRACVARSAKVGSGSVIFALAAINAESCVGANCIINTAATVDHDGQLGDHVHLCPGVHLAGTVQVGEGAMLGTGAVVLPGVSIGPRSVVAAGAVVVRDVPAGVMAAGVPAIVKQTLASSPEPS
jgi:sugar O-acyltransferase (sialic acid O-acetyltransferase NeuD family)